MSIITNYGSRITHVVPFTIWIYWKFLLLIQKENWANNNFRCGLFEPNCKQNNQYVYVYAPSNSIADSSLLSIDSKHGYQYVYVYAPYILHQIRVSVLFFHTIEWCLVLFVQLLPDLSSKSPQRRRLRRLSESSRLKDWYQFYAFQTSIAPLFHNFTFTRD